MANNDKNEMTMDSSNKHKNNKDKMSKEEYQRLSEQLRVKLVNAQYDLKDSDTSVVLLLAGNDLPGCEEFIDVLQDWVDVRYVDTRAFRLPTEEEQKHPPLWRYWQALPRDGRMAVFYGAWVMNLMLEVSNDNIQEKELEIRLRRLRNFENLLVRDGKKVLKVWLHASEDDLKKRLKKARKNPDSELYVGQFYEQIYKTYKRSDPAIECLNSVLNEEVAWQWVDGSDKRSRDVTIAQRLLALMESDVPAGVGEVNSDEQSYDKESSGEENSSKSKSLGVYRPTQKNYLADVDLSKRLSYDDYKALLKAAQLRLKYVVHKCRELEITPVLAFEGWDAAGKGGVIRRITRSMSAWAYRVFPIAAPTQEELKYHYLWRFWKAIPRAGKVVIFDRTWYGRVLVERIEGYAKPKEWQRAYGEICDFETQLSDARCCVVKFWLHIDADEQLHRFQQREKTQYKKYKITDDDYRNREKWGEYEDAVNDMVQHTSTDAAPWFLIPANDKRYARVMIIQTICEELESFVKKVGPPSSVLNADKQDKKDKKNKKNKNKKDKKSKNEW